MMKKKAYILIGLMLLISLNAFAVEYPKATSWVNDYAGVLGSGQKQDLDSILATFEEKSSNQIFVAILDRIPSGTYLEEYVNELFTRWQPGQKGQDNGVLLAIFIKDRKLRIEVGYGLEGPLTDAASKLIIANDITPSFKQGDYYGGIRKGLQSIILTIQPGYNFPVTPAQPQPRSQKPSSYQINPLFIFFVLWVVLILFSGVVKTIRGTSEGWSSSSTGWNRSRQSNVWIVWLILRILLSVFASGSRGSHSHWRSGSSWGGSRRSSGRGGGGFRGFSGGGGGRSGGGGASGGW